MALQKAERTGNTTPFKFEKGGDKLAGYYVRTTDEVINGSTVKKHVFKTANGYLSVLGQADMYKQLVDNECKNTYVEITFSGDVQKLKGGKTMKLYDVAFDRSDTLDGETVPSVTEDDTDDMEPMDEPELPRAAAPARKPAPESVDRVRALLNSRK